MKQLFAVWLSALGFSFPAHAEPSCAPAAQLNAYIEGLYGPSKTTGVTTKAYDSAPHLANIFIDKTGRYVIVISRSDGTWCVMVAGEGWGQ